MKMKLKKFLALVKQYQAIADPVARAAAMKTLENVEVVDDTTGETVNIELVQLDAEPENQGGGDNTSDGNGEGGADNNAADTGEANGDAGDDAGNAGAQTRTAARPAAKNSQANPAQQQQQQSAASDDEEIEARITRSVIARLGQQNRTPAPAVRTVAVATRKAHQAVASGNTGSNFVIPAEVKRVKVKNFQGVVDGRSADERAYRFGMWALAQLTRQMPARFNFTKAVDFVQSQKLQRGGDNGAGGYLIPDEFGTDLIDLREKYGVVRNLFKMRTMTGDTRTDPRRKSGLTAYFTSDGGSGTESSKQWDQVMLVAKDLMVLSRYTANLEADAVISIGDDLAYEIAYSFAQKEDDCGINGDGSSPFGGIVGVRTKLAAATAGLVTGSGTGWDGLALADFNKVSGLLPQYADTNDVCWVAHKTFYAGVMQKLELAAGGVTAMEVQQGDRRPRPLFLGYPVQISQIMPSASASSQIPVMLGNFALAATFGDRQQDEIAFSEHATVGGESLWEKKQIGIRGTERFDINVHDVGDTAAPGPVVGIKTS